VEFVDPTRRSSVDGVGHKRPRSDVDVDERRALLVSFRTCRVGCEATDGDTALTIASNVLWCRSIARPGRHRPLGAHNFNCTGPLTPPLPATTITTARPVFVEQSGRASRVAAAVAGVGSGAAPSSKRPRGEDDADAGGGAGGVPDSQRIRVDFRNLFKDVAALGATTFIGRDKHVWEAKQMAALGAKVKPHTEKMPLKMWLGVSAARKRRAAAAVEEARQSGVITGRESELEAAARGDRTGSRWRGGAGKGRGQGRLSGDDLVAGANPRDITPAHIRGPVMLARAPAPSAPYTGGGGGDRGGRGGGRGGRGGRGRGRGGRGGRGGHR